LQEKRHRIAVLPAKVSVPANSVASLTASAFADWKGRQCPMASKSKRQQTMAKRNREQAVKEKTELRLQKKYAAAQERQAQAEADSLQLRPHQGPS
jgi:hypothetical protein